MAKLPNGLDRMYDALVQMPGDRIDRALTLGFVRMMFDPDAPVVAGFDPHVMKRGLFPLVPPFAYMAQDGNAAGWLTAVTEQLNAMMGEEILVTDWPDLRLTRDAMLGLGRYRIEEHATGGDLLGNMLEQLRPDMVKGEQGAYYTPAPVSDMMAMIVQPQPGESVIDPSCGSGRMLLSALKSCRESYPGEPLPRLYGTDIDPMAVKACKLNLQLAGYYVETAAGNGLRDLIVHCDTPQGRIISLRSQHPELPLEPVAALPPVRRERPGPQSTSLFDEQQAA